MNLQNNLIDAEVYLIALICPNLI